MPMNYSRGRTEQFPGEDTRTPITTYPSGVEELRLTDAFNDTFIFRRQLNGDVYVGTNSEDPDVELANVWLSDEQRRELLEFLR